MIACPWCGYAHPNQQLSSHCLQCQRSFADLYICTKQNCSGHGQFQVRQRTCQFCGEILIGEFSGRDIPWGHATYRVREYLGGGGMGEVYRAIEQNNANTYQREVAIKFNKNMMERDIIERFKQEVQILSILQDPHNIRVYTYGELFDERSRGEVRAQFMVMELLKGQDLNQLIKGPGLTPKEAVPIFIEICGALSEAHQKGIIHRDLKPHNIMLQDVAGGKFAKVFDFGLSRMTTKMDDRLSTSGVVMGTFRYMSPEQALSEEMDHRTDIFSLGVVLYEVLTGRSPFPAKNLFELFMYHQQGAPPLETNCPKLEAILMKMLAFDKEERYQSIDEVRQDLQNLDEAALAESYFVAPTLDDNEDSPLSSARQLSNAYSRARALSQANAQQKSRSKVSAQQTSSKKMPLLVSLAIFLALLVGVGIYLLYSQRPKEKTILMADGRRIPLSEYKRFQQQQQQGQRQGRSQRFKRQLSSRKGSTLTKLAPTSPRPLAPPLLRRKAPPVRKKRYRRRRRRRRFAHYRRRRYRRHRPRRTFRLTPPPPPVRPIQPSLPPPRPVLSPQPTIPRPRPRPRPIIIRKVIPSPPPPRPRKKPCPHRSPYVLYSQLDRALGSSLNTRISRLLNKAARSTVYDAGLRLSPSWKPAPVICKRSYLCRRISNLVRRYCRQYRPYPHCRHYRVRFLKKKFICVR